MSEISMSRAIVIGAVAGLSGAIYAVLASSDSLWQLLFAPTGGALSAAFALMVYRLAPADQIIRYTLAGAFGFGLFSFFSEIGKYPLSWDIMNAVVGGLLGGGVGGALWGIGRKFDKRLT